MERVKSAIAGCGGIAGAHVKGLKLLWENDIKTFEIVSVCDIDEARAEKMAEDIGSFQGYKPAVYTDVDEMLVKSLTSRLLISVPHIMSIIRWLSSVYRQRSMSL